MTATSTGPTTGTIRCGGRERTRAEALDRAARVASGLTALGVSRGDRVALVLRNDIEFIETSIGIGLIGAVPVPVNWHWKGTELSYLLSDCAAAAAFVHTDLLPVVRDALERQIPLVQVVPSPALRAGYGGSDKPDPDLPELQAWLAEQQPRAEESVSAPLGVIYTSGTTGKPKGILRDPVPPAGNAVILERLFGTMGMAPGMRTLVPAPLYHSAPNAHALVAFAAGLDLTIMPRFGAREFLELVAAERLNHAQVVPTMFVRLLRLSESERAAFDLSSLQAIVHAAAPCPPEVKHRMIEWLGPIILEYYGGSETGAVVACNSQEWLAHPGTVGHPVFGGDVRIHLADGSLAPTGTVGEVYLKPANGWPDFTYIGNDAKRRGMERDGYVTLGDAGRLDEDGYLYLSDRLSDMVISGGVNIYPAEIEQTLITLPGVRDVAVFGIPDPDYGEALAAHVDTDPDAGLTEDDLRAHVRAELAGYKVPKVVVIDHELPREDSGKLFKRRIRARYWPAP